MYEEFGSEIALTAVVPLNFHNDSDTCTFAALCNILCLRFLSYSKLSTVHWKLINPYLRCAKQSGKKITMEDYVISKFNICVVSTICQDIGHFIYGSIANVSSQLGNSATVMIVTIGRIEPVATLMPAMTIYGQAATEAVVLPTLPSSLCRLRSLLPKTHNITVQVSKNSEQNFSFIVTWPLSTLSSADSITIRISGMAFEGMIYDTYAILQRV